MKTTPITSRLRANKQIKKDPNAQPILHVGEVSPLKQAKQIGKETTTTEPDQIVKQKTAGDILKTPDAISGGTAGSGYDNKMTELLNQGLTYEQLAAAGHGTVGGLTKRFPGYGENTGRGPDKEIETIIPGESKTEQEPFYTREKSDRISPYQYYQNRLIAKRSVGADKRKERGQQRDLAKEYARKEGGNLIDKLKNRRKVMRGEASQEDFTRAFGNVVDPKTGKTEGEKRFNQSQQNYEVYRGISDKQQAAHVDTDQPHQQLNQHRGRGKSIVGRNRVATVTDIDNRDVQSQINNLGDGVVALDDGKVTKGPPMKTRHLNSVGIKQSSPIKKGYFKNK